ncbi:MAG TPA: hypothetical protein VGZ93_09135 [Candidatus Methylacidiphilales bacterium]|jgi:hypothetical protein|nr:hypothetical protein [Candidatus Methylacidiphilales bacterium]
MTPFVSSRLPQKKWRRLSLLFLSLLPVLAIFHLVMWFCFTRYLFRPETGSSKRIGYLVSLEDRKAKLEALEPQTGFTIVDMDGSRPASGTRVVYFGDSFGGSIAKACSIRWHEPVGGLAVDWSRKNGLSQIEAWLRDDWFRNHGVKVIILERFECEWLDSFADAGDSTLDIPLAREMAGDIPPSVEKAKPWTFANNGNFKVIIDNFAYLFSPTAFDMTDTCVVHLNENFFDCSYGRLLLFYRGEITRGVCNTVKNLPRFEQALANLKEVSDLCRSQGLKFYLVVPPNKSTLYYDWVVHPFYSRSGTLKMLRERAAPFGYVDVGEPLHEKLESGYQDLYYPDDHHWNYPAAVIAAEELTRAGAGPAP